MKRTFCKMFGILVIVGICWAQQVHAQSTVEVATVGLTFSPPDVEISVGDSVHWTGLFGVLHTVAEVDDASAATWNGGFHSAGGAFEFTHLFDTAGTFHYICEPHVFSGMRGTVTVLPPVGCCWTCDGITLSCDGPIIREDCPPTNIWIEDESCGTEICGTGQCVAPPVCGDNTVNQPAEQCDGSDDAACPEQCQADCLCPPEGTVPSVSAWGIAVLALLLLVGGRVYFRRRRTTQA